MVYDREYGVPQVGSSRWDGHDLQPSCIARQQGCQMAPFRVGRYARIADVFGLAV